jgi:hypothetical protein
MLGLLLAGAAAATVGLTLMPETAEAAPFTMSAVPAAPPETPSRKRRGYAAGCAGGMVDAAYAAGAVCAGGAGGAMAVECAHTVKGRPEATLRRRPQSAHESSRAAGYQRHGCLRRTHTKSDFFFAALVLSRLPSSDKPHRH